MDKKVASFDLNRVSYQDILNLEALEELGDKEKANDASMDLMVRTIVSWEFVGDPSIEKIKEMGLVDFVALQRQFNTELKAIFREDDETE